MSNKKNFISVKRGLSQDPKHREQMGNRIWLFLHIIDRTDWETGIVNDWRDKDEADDMGMAWRTLQKQRQELEEAGYISCKRNRDKQRIIVYNWHNPRNYSGEIMNPKSTQKSVLSDVEGTHQGTHESTQQSDSILGTPTLDSQITDQRPHITRKRAKQPDPRSSHPAIQAYRALTSRYPQAINYDRIINLLGETPDNEKLQAAFENWCGRGYNPTNLSWLDWYKNGVPTNGSGHKNGKRDSMEIVYEYMNEKGMLADG